MMAVSAVPTKSMKNIFEHEQEAAKAKGQLSLGLLGGGKMDRRNEGNLPFLRPYVVATGEPVPWQPMQAHMVEFSGHVEPLNRAVTKLNGVLYYGTDVVILVIPSSCDLDRLGEVLKAEGGGKIFRVSALGPP